MARIRARVVVGGVGHLYQGDLDFGRVAVERLRDEDLGDAVVIEDFSYGAVAVAQRLQELQPQLLVLVGAKERGRAPGTVERRVIHSPNREPAELQGAIADAVTGYIDIDLVIDVAHGLAALPPEVVAVEVEPATTAPADSLSAEAEAALPEALELVRAAVSADPPGVRERRGSS